MKITILGSGTSTGVPMVGCPCLVCSSEDSHDRRTRPSLLVENAGRFILIDTSPDLRQQALREKIPHIDAVLFTHHHADHINGIDDLRGFHFIHKRLIPCYGSHDTLAAIVRVFPYIFSGKEADGYPPLLAVQPAGDIFSLFGLTIRMVPLLHGTMGSTGFRMDNVAYITDCSAIPASSRALLDNLDILIVDGLRYTPHPNHFTIEEAVELAAELKPRRTILTHLTHEVAYGERVNLPAGVDFAYDGMTMDSDFQETVLSGNKEA